MSLLRILVCHYKPAPVLTDGDVYFNIQCGRDDTNLILDMQGDNTGVNISARNRYWSEITGLYWAWKNLEKTKYVGLCSYRRFFNFKNPEFTPFKIIGDKSSSEVAAIKLPEFDKIFNKYDVIVPKPYVYAYSIKKVCSMNYRDDDFAKLEKLVHDLSPDYDEAYRAVLYETNKMIGHNMFIMSWENFDDYCRWVFNILFELEKIIEPNNYPTKQVRVFGYMHELLLAVYIEKNNLRKFYSQVTWITNSANGFKFNKFYYRLLATVYYRFCKLYADSKRIIFAILLK